MRKGTTTWLAAMGFVVALMGCQGQDPAGPDVGGEKGLKTQLPAEGKGKVDAPGEGEGRPEVCAAVWQPVCGEDGKTYGNACEAARAGIAVAREGECSAIVPVPVPDTGKDCRPDPVKPGDDRVCLAVWDPVCGKDGKTYGNACEAARAGADVAREGACGLQP